VQVAELINAFVATAEAAVREVPPESVVAAGVAELSKAGFVAGVTGTPAIREHIKVRVGVRRWVCARGRARACELGVRMPGPYGQACVRL
jgi:hypothetical protein